ncbi:MAG: ATP-binding protein [Candidatus Cloacimonetes bacterium]|nr:ATP-binding protein [Candidatus Cloacimonadota bacterium]
MAKFVNREKELSALETFWQQKKSQLVIVYGKRRVGKSRLCLKFANNKPSIYFLAEKLPANLQLSKLSRQIGEFFQDNLVAKQGIESWELLFEYLAQKREKLVLIIDEFPYLVEAEPAIPSIFQKGWDLYLAKSPIFLILCGSSVSMMLESTLSVKAPLYGRRSGQLLVRPFDFPVLSKFFPKKNFEERIKILGILGGTPAYLEAFSEKLSLEENLKQTVLAKEHALYQEVEFLLREELREPRNYFAILTAIAQNNTKLGEIMNHTGFDKPTTSRYLSILQNLDLITREVPITEKRPEKSKRGIYKLKDEFFRFWFTFVFPHRDKLEAENKKYVLDILEEKKEEFFSFTYENIAVDILRKALEEYKLPFSFEKYGRWWNSHAEIDFVGLCEKERTILFGEVKYSKQKIGLNELNKLKEKAKLIDWQKTKQKEVYAFFSKSGFNKKLLEVAKEEGLLLFQGDKLLTKPLC